MREYSTSILKSAVCPILGVDFDAIVAASALSGEAKAKSRLSVSGQDFLTLWSMIIDRAASFDPLFLGRMMANGPMVPIFLAFSCAPDLETAIQRLARYKTLFGPVGLHVSNSRHGFRVEIVPEGDGLVIPASLAVPIAIFIVEKTRSHSARNIAPRAVALPSHQWDTAVIQTYFGCAVEQSASVAIEFPQMLRRLRFISENETLWREIEVDLEQQLRMRTQQNAFHIEVEAAIRAALYAGSVHVELICHMLQISRSTLQRRLRQEGYAFQDVLNRVRSELAERYLVKSSFSLQEIARMLGFADPKSFHRAFKQWSGKTPRQFRTIGSDQGRAAGAP